MRRLFFLPVIVLSLFVGHSAVAQPVEKAKHYAIALSWQPQFCETHRDKAECRDQVGRYDASNLALHGLWPQPRNLAYCGVSSSDKKADLERRWSDLPPVVLSDALRAELDIHMPGTQSLLDRHEWIKHGTCSGMSMEEYFRTSVELTKAASKLKLDDLIGENAGGSITVDQLCDAVLADFGSAYRRAISVSKLRGPLQEILIGLRALPDGLVVLKPAQLERLPGSNLNCERGSDRRRITIDEAGF